jgi:flagellar biosynthetic protein FliR
MELVKLLNEQNAIILILLFSRISGVMAFFPFFSHTAIPNSVKAATALFLTFFFFPMIGDADVATNGAIELLLMAVMEFALGFIAGLVLNLVFGAIGLAAMQISMVMGFSMATVIDPVTQTNSPIVSQFLTLLAILIFLSFDGHHLILLFLSDSIGHLSLGAFYPDSSIYEYLLKAVSQMFVIGFIMAFPIIALSILSDVIFGMLMKTMPQFNLLVVGFPIKIFLSFLVLIAVLGSMMGIFKDEFMNYFSYLKSLLD